MQAPLAPVLAFSLSILPVADAYSGPTLPQDVLFEGSMAATNAHKDAGWCAIDNGASTFEKEGVRMRHISFEDVSYHVGDEYYVLSGLARLKFKTAAGGAVRFDTVGNVPRRDRRLSFSQYAETYSARSGRLTVSFNLHVNDCVVPVEAIYRN
jgi:hypothetical protein